MSVPNPFRRTAAAGLLLPLLLIAGCSDPAQPGLAPSTGHDTAPSPTAAGSQPNSPATSPTQGSPAASTSAEPGESSAAASATPTADPTPRPSGPPTCRELAGELSLKQRIGQLFMAGTSTSGITAEEADRLAALKVGSVVVLGNSTAGRDAAREVTEDIRDQLGSEHGVKVLLAVDQEGGQVQRLAGPGFDDIPSANEQAELSDKELRNAAESWGEDLRKAGIDADLAPVSDVVPESIGSANEPIGALERGYGPDVDVVADKNVAFIRGIHDAGLATSVKHFPGLGKVRGNTDFSDDTVDEVTTADDKDLQSFRASIEAGTDMVMMSSATYSKIDDDGPATFSSTIISGMLREDLGFDGVVISDALEGVALGDYSTRSRALRFIRAGGDLAIVGAPDAVAPMVKAVRQAAEDDPELQQLIMDASTRVLIMKSRYDLADCQA